MSETNTNTASFRLDYTPPTFTIDTLDLEFDLYPMQTQVRATSTVRRINAGESCLKLDGEQLELIAIEIDGQPWSDYQHEENQLILNAVPDTFTLTIETKINPEQNTLLDGLYFVSDTFCTQCEAQGFRRITFFLDRPDVLARYTTKITADKAKFPYLLSNGNRIAGGDLDEERHWVQWQDPFPKPCYLFALVAGDFDLLRDQFVTRSGRTVDLELYVEQGQLDKTSHAMLALKNSMKWDEQRFGFEYDLDIYMIVAIDFFNMGAMENKGLNVFNTKYILANPNTATDTDLEAVEAVVGHEYFHNWTGNRITCRDWFQLSLKEGLTVFRDQEFSADMRSRGVYRIQQAQCMRDAQFTEDASPMAHPIRPDVVMEMNNFYTCTVYEKGAEVIRMMHRILGEEGFQKGIRLYVERHDGQAVTCDDFVQAMIDSSGADLEVFKRWYSQSGTPRVAIHEAYDAAEQTYTITCHQHTPETQDQKQKQAVHIPLQTSLYAQDGTRVHSDILHLKQEEQTFIFKGMAEKPTPSFLDDFSAPVKLTFNYTPEQLQQLASCAQDPFSRWDALQILTGQLFTQAVSAHQAEQSLPSLQPLVDVFQSILREFLPDLRYQAMLLTFPSVTSLLDLFEEACPHALCDVRDSFITGLAKALEPDWKACYARCLEQDSSTQDKGTNVRALKNVCLYYLGRADASCEATIYQSTIMKAFAQAENMTDRMAALTAARDANYSCFQDMLTQFEQQWSSDVLVMDKWLALQASDLKAQTLDTVKNLCEHPHFSLKNPNRVYSLIGTFANRNLKAFHAKAGEGYAFLTQCILQLDALNPQVASRMVTPLISFKRFAKPYQEAMKKCLEQLAQAQVSVNVLEKVNKALD